MRTWKYTMNITPMSVNRALHIVMIYPFKGAKEKSPRIMLTKEAQAWYEELVPKLRVQRANHRATAINFEVSVEVWIYREKRVGDVDNFAKGVLDAMVKAGILEDDKWVMDLNLHKLHDPRQPRYEVEITEKPRQVGLFEILTNGGNK